MAVAVANVSPLRVEFCVNSASHGSVHLTANSLVRVRSSLSVTRSCIATALVPRYVHVAACGSKDAWGYLDERFLVAVLVTFAGRGCRHSASLERCDGLERF